MLERIVGTRVVASENAIDRAVFEAGAIVMRFAPDDLFVIGDGNVVVDDPYAIIREDSGWVGVWIGADLAEAFLVSTCDWPRPTERPAFVQGMVAQLAVKLYFMSDRTLIMVPAPLEADLRERLGGLA